MSAGVTFFRRQLVEDRWDIYFVESNHYDLTSILFPMPNEIGFYHDTGEIRVGVDLDEVTARLLMAVFMEGIGAESDRDVL